MSLVFLLSWLCAITALIVYDKRNQGIQSMLNYTIPADTEVVRFEGNSITHIPYGYFNLSNLLKAQFLRNDISNIDDFAFVAVPMVTYIEMRENELTVIGMNTFRGLPNLDRMLIDKNKIHTIECDSFKDNTALNRLYLTSNKLEIITQCMFKGLHNLAILYLAKNNIHTIESRSFKDNIALTDLTFFNNELQTISQCIFDVENHPTGLNVFTIHSNPLSCDESLCWLLQADGDWISTYNPHLITCAQPGSLIGRTWDTLTSADLHCGQTTTCPGKVMQSSFLI